MGVTELRELERTTPDKPGGTAGREKVVERLVAWIWERQALVGPLLADDGHAYQVVFRGRPWGERGPDFQGAIVARADGTLLRGDVEVHVRASDWRKHRHGRDPAYNQTACHVVLWRDDARPTVRQDGVAVPTLELVTHLAAPLAKLEQRLAAERPPDGRGREPSAASLPACVPDPDQLGALLDRAGLARFHERAAAFEGDLACFGPAEVLYRGVARAMGYTANTRGFERLAEAVPLAALAEVARAPVTGRSVETRPGDAAIGDGALARAQALLLGAAGLLPSQRGIEIDDGWPRALERAWADVRGGVGAPLPLGTWRAWRVRPENLPARRTAGLSQLVVGQLDGQSGLSQLARRGGPAGSDAFNVILDDLADAERTERPARLAEHWRARAHDPFWPAHVDFGRRATGDHAWLIGAGRADEVAVNVLLPFLYAVGQASGEAALSARAVALYRRYPSTAPNRVTREMARQLGGQHGAQVARGACRQQGLIHLYRHWCDAHDCATCLATPLATPTGGSHQRAGRTSS